MTPTDLTDYLSRLVRDSLDLSVMIWGAPGIGKSSIVSAVARDAGIGCIDLRLSQLAPTDLRGLPVAEEGLSRWLPPEFLPRDGRGILFLDEINMAPPVMQGVAQQLILDRRVGSYAVPDGWHIWAAGNRKEDRASVFDMPAPLANRFIHFEVSVHLPSFRAYALRAGIHEQVIAFTAFRSELLHKVDARRPAWPSPRSWEFASRLHGAGLDVAPAVGEGPAAEFSAFVALYRDLHDVEKILSGAERPAFPKEPSARYALVLALLARGRDAAKALSALRYLAALAPAEWVQLYALDAIPLLRAQGMVAQLAVLLREEPEIAAFLRDYRELIGLGSAAASSAPPALTASAKKKK